MIEKIASVYVFEEKIVLTSNSQLKMGMWFTHEPYIKLPKYCSDTEIATSLNAVLEASKQGIDNTNNTKDANKAFLKGLGVKSLKELHERANAFSVFSSEDSFVFEPAKNLGSKKGFAPILSAVVKINQNSTANIIADTFNLALQVASNANK